MSLTRQQMAARAARELNDGEYVNLGIDEVDSDLINAGQQTVSVLRGGSFFDSPTSFAMIRGGHIDTAVLGAMQVSVTGDLANMDGARRPRERHGGRVDLVSGGGRVLAVMDHVTKQGEPKLLASCPLPLTGCRVWSAGRFSDQSPS